MNKVFDNDQAAEVVAQQTGGRVVKIERQLRWRPTWFVDVERDGETLGYVLRGDRTDSEAYPLPHENKFHELLMQGGIRVPRLDAYIETPGFIDAMLMEKVPGKATFEDTDDVDRDQVVREYIEALAQMHKLDPTPFIEAGIVHPKPGQEAAQVGFQHLLGKFRARKNHVDPFGEFCLGFYDRYPPQSHGRMAPIVWDSGQFHHENGHLVAVIDLEFGHVGDPMLDLTVWRMRDTLIKFGDFQKIYAYYEELTGQPVDLETIKRCHFAAAMANQLQFGAAVAHPDLNTDLMNFMQWDSETNLMTTDFLGEYLGIELPTVEIPEPIPTPDDATFGQLVNTLGSVVAPDRELAHTLRLAFRMARHLQRRSEIGDVLDQADIDDVHELLGGRRPGSWIEATKALEDFCIADAPEGKYDEQLTVLFHKRNMRTHMSLGPQGSSMTRHYVPQSFAGEPSRIVQL